jgi:hypothetical protein
VTCEASEEETFYGSTMGRRRGLVHISCKLFPACVFVSSRDAPTLAITTTDLKPSGYPLLRGSVIRNSVTVQVEDEPNQLIAARGHWGIAGARGYERDLITLRYHGLG